MAVPQHAPAFRRLEVQWDAGLIAASIAVSLLGAFTSTQMMCQARASRYFSGVLLWTILGSLTFGFCSIWCLHFIAMLACELPLLVGLNVPLVVLSAVLAVVFTFLALASEHIRDGYARFTREKRCMVRRHSRKDFPRANGSMDALLGRRLIEEEEGESNLMPTAHANVSASHDIVRYNSGARMTLEPLEDHFAGKNLPEDATANPAPSPDRCQPSLSRGRLNYPRYETFDDNESSCDTESLTRILQADADMQRPSSGHPSEISSLGLPGFMSFKTPETTTAKATNALVGLVQLLFQEATLRNFSKGMIWSLAITSMHYVGLLALKIPGGYITLQPLLVLLSAVISWLVCTVGCILMPKIEVNLSQQLIFSVVAAVGVAAMHFTGMWATTFWSGAPATSEHGYPPNLAVAVTSIAILTCMLANGLLAHSATVARNKLAEVVQTKRKLWAAIAQKENAEAAAAARSEFIASASHEIRTPLHQLQGYSDLMSRTEMTEEARLLLLAIQQATRSLSMITANVLDWSRLEKGEAVTRPTCLDVRKVCESILTILPAKDDDVDTELLVVVAPDVPNSLYLDGTYLQRILLNLLTNALKFTPAGYVILLVGVEHDELVVTVRDSGYGIPESFLPHVFEPFKQAQTRGAERGTGLGLAIIKQLLQKMQGTISVESKYQQAENVGPQRCGSTFQVTIPVTISVEEEPDKLGFLSENRRIAMFGDCNARFGEGLRFAWKVFGFEFVLADPEVAMSGSWAYIWTDLIFLKAHPDLLRRVLELHDRPVIVSYDSQALLDESLGPVAPPHIVPVRRPFVWHRMVESLLSAARTGRPLVDRAVRFAAVVDVIENRATGTNQAHKTKTPNGSTVLLVEDNKINQRLGVKMLKMLGYNVIVAEDGQDAIEKLVDNDEVIDIILMDQSMPRMDGITAATRIREMELAGSLARSRRPIVMVTAVVGPDAQNLCVSASTDAFLPKPLAMSKLESTLEKFLG